MTKLRFFLQISFMEFYVVLYDAYENGTYFNEALLNYSDKVVANISSYSLEEITEGIIDMQDDFILYGFNISEVENKVKEYAESGEYDFCDIGTVFIA